MYRWDFSVNEQSRKRSISSMASRLTPMTSKLKTACSATEWWPILKMMVRLERRARSTSARAAARSSSAGRGSREMRA
jgi:hypothetical protein